jgi:hypothetical protein
VSTAASSAGSTPPAAPAPAPEQPPAAAEKQASPAADTVEAAVDPFANVPPLEANSPIDLQAISWAESAAQRIAVINNVVLHEGDSVEGYFVVQIRPDDVVLRREGRMWRANFAIR